MSNQLWQFHVQSLNGQVDLFSIRLIEEVLELTGLGVVSHKNTQRFAIDQLLEVYFFLII